MKSTLVAMLSATFLAAGLGTARAQGAAAPETKMFVSVEFGAQPRQSKIAAASSFPLYDETATVTSEQAIHNGSVFGASAGYRLRPRLGVAIGVSMFNARESDATVVASIPDLIFFGRHKIVTQTATGLKHTEQGIHLQAVWFQRLGAKLEVVLSGGPSAFSVKQDVMVGFSVQPGTQNITVKQETQKHNAIGFNGGVEGNYLFSRRLGAGLFVRYAGATTDLPAVPNLKVGGLQAGLGVRLRF